MRKRPLSLDADAEAMKWERQDVEQQPMEPDYGLMAPGLREQQERIRVARVQNSEESPDRSTSAMTPSERGLGGHPSGLETHGSSFLMVFPQA